MNCVSGFRDELIRHNTDSRNAMENLFIHFIILPLRHHPAR